MANNLPAGWVEQTMTAGELSPQTAGGLTLIHTAITTWVARGWGGQLIAVVPEHQLVVAIGSAPTNDMALEGNDMWLWVNDVIVTALE